MIRVTLYLSDDELHALRRSPAAVAELREGESLTDAALVKAATRAVSGRGPAAPPASSAAAGASHHFPLH